MDMPAYTANPNVALGTIEERHKTIRIILDELRRSFRLSDYARAKFLILKIQMTEACQFLDEEEIMAQFRYDDLNAHKAEHDRILDT